MEWYVGGQPKWAGGGERALGEQWGEEIRIPGLTRRTNRGAAALCYTAATDCYGPEESLDLENPGQDSSTGSSCQISDASRLTPTCIQDPPRWYS